MTSSRPFDCLNISVEAQDSLLLGLLTTFRSVLVLFFSILDIVVKSRRLCIRNDFDIFMCRGDVEYFVRSSTLEVT